MRRVVRVSCAEPSPDIEAVYLIQDNFSLFHQREVWHGVNKTKPVLDKVLTVSK